MEYNSWAETRKLLSDVKDMPEHVIDYIATVGIIKQCAHGIGNLRIAYFNNLEVEQVESILFQFLGFEGWLLDLDINPWSVFETSQGNYEFYEMKILSLTNLVDCDIIRLSYKVCKTYKRIKEEIDKYD